MSVLSQSQFRDSLLSINLCRLADSASRILTTSFVRCLAQDSHGLLLSNHPDVEPKVKQQGKDSIPRKCQGICYSDLVSSIHGCHETGVSHLSLKGAHSVHVPNLGQSNNDRCNRPHPFIILDLGGKRINSLFVFDLYS